MQILITDKATVQAVRHFLVNSIIYAKPDTPAPSKTALRNILLYTESVYVNANLEETTMSIYLTTRPKRNKVNYPVFTVFVYRTYLTDLTAYPQHLKPVVTFIFNKVRNAIINVCNNQITTAITYTIDNTYDTKLINKIPEMY